MEKKQMELLKKEEQIHRLLVSSLRREGFETLEAMDLEEDAASGEQVILLSLSTILMDGEEFKKRRPQVEYYTSPQMVIRLLGQLDQDKDGKDIELCCHAKPILMAVRLTQGNTINRMPESIPDMTFGPLTIQYRKRQCVLSGKNLNLTRKELDLLVYMAHYRNLPLTRGQLLDAVWGKEQGSSRDVRTVDTHIKRLRIKLGPCSRLVETVRGVGYCFRWQDQPLLGEDHRLFKIV